ncbi:MAG: hypothetical protein KDL31_00485 [Kiritimatiellae bacterium]|nr:hypothetical protein [Kiritimatiellia bacterium]
MQTTSPVIGSIEQLGGSGPGSTGAGVADLVELVCVDVDCTCASVTRH